MRKYKIILFIGLMLLFSLFSIESGVFSSVKKIPYSEIDSINWLSFKKLPNYFDKYSAEIYSSIIYRIESDSIIFGSFMYPFKSYVIFPDLLPDLALYHEKYHFKITELLSRKFGFEIHNENKPYNENRIQEIYQKIHEDENLIQKVFDLDTKHGQDTLIQKIWFQVIDTLLEVTDLTKFEYKVTSPKEYSTMLIKPTLAYLFRRITTDDSLRLQLTYFDDGNIRSEIIYKNEKPDGYYYKWHENGSINQTILYKDGIREGLSVTFNLFGDTIESHTYSNNKIVD